MILAEHDRQSRKGVEAVEAQLSVKEQQIVLKQRFSDASMGIQNKMHTSASGARRR